MSNNIRSTYFTTFAAYWGETRVLAFLTNNEKVQVNMEYYDANPELRDALINDWVDQFMASDSDDAEDFFDKVFSEAIDSAETPLMDLYEYKQNSILLPFQPGDSLFWINEDGHPHIQEQKNAIAGVVYYGNGEFRMLEEDCTEPTVPNSDSMTCLTYEKAAEFFEKDYGVKPDEIEKSYKMWSNINIFNGVLCIYQPGTNIPFAKFDIENDPIWINFPETKTEILAQKINGNFQIKVQEKGSAEVYIQKKNTPSFCESLETVYLDIPQPFIFNISMV